MLEDSASAIPSSIWASMNSWFTPTVLFLLLNLMIATIAFTSSSFSNHKQHQNQNQNQNQKTSPIARSPSVLQRLKSINFYSSPPPQDSSLLHHKPIPDSDIQAAHYFFQHLNPHETAVSDEQIARKLQSDLDLELKNPIREEKEIEENLNLNHERSMDEVYSQLTVTDSHFSRTKSDTKPTAEEIPAKLPAKMRKSASVKSAFAHFEEGDIVEARRPATVREKGNARATEVNEEEGCVDAKADDFINRFKQQLKLQRLDSIIRYKDMIGRGR